MVNQREIARKRARARPFDVDISNTKLGAMRRVELVTSQGDLTPNQEALYPSNDSKNDRESSDPVGSVGGTFVSRHWRACVVGALVGLSYAAVMLCLVCRK
jgi:hypothetical protein